jgi:hypothetical protein
VAHLDEYLQTATEMQIAAERLHITALHAMELPERTPDVPHRSGERLPLVELVQLLDEVVRWTQFSAVFTHAGAMRHSVTNGSSI